MQIFIKTYTGKRPVLQVEADATVASVKEQIWEKEQIPPEQQVLYFAGKALRDECAVSDYEIQSECTLELEPSPRAISIHVQKISGEFMEISAYSTDTTADLKERIRKAPGGVAEEVQTLVFQNVVLEDPAVKPFERLCESQYTLQLVIKQQHQLETLQIKPTGGNLFEVAVSSYDTLQRLKEMIAEQQGIPVEKQLLVYAGAKLEDDRTIGEYDFKGNLHLVRRASIDVMVKTLTGKSFSVNICQGETIESVKQKIEKSEALPADLQRLIFAGKQLLDHEKVQDYKLADGNTIHLVMRQGGVAATSVPGTCDRSGACGLSNMGNTCYLNSTLQALSNTVALRRYYEEGHYKAEICTSPDSMGGRLADGFANLLRSLWGGNCRVVSPGKLRELINEKRQQFAGYRQHDAQELLAFFLDGLHEDVNRSHRSALSKGEVAEEANGSAASGSAPDDLEGRSKIMDVFQFKVRSKITFDDLDVEPSLKFEPMVYLSLPISEVPSVPSYRPEVNLLDCLHQFATREELGEDDWAYCETTRRCERSSKQLDLWTAPECLIIHLKRFAVDFASGDTEKIDTFVRFPMDLDLAPFVMGPGGQDAQYRLYAVVNHSGSLSFGHYTAYCKVGEEEHDRRWYLFNDATVSAARESDVVSREAYMLFYERVPVHEPSCQPNS